MISFNNDGISNIQLSVEMQQPSNKSKLLLCLWFGNNKLEFCGWDAEKSMQYLQCIMHT